VPVSIFRLRPLAAVFAAAAVIVLTASSVIPGTAASAADANAAAAPKRAAPAPAPAPAALAAGDDLIGIVSTVTTQEQDTLLDLARDNDVGYVEIRAANPGIDPWLPGAGRTVLLPTAHILPDAPRTGIVINLAELRLYYFPPRGSGETTPRTFPIGIGGEGKETPVGRTSIASKRVHPTWNPTPSERQGDPDLPEHVPAGPDNPMGDYALYLGWKAYAIHGTNKPYSIGRRDSSGCIRLLPEDIETLFKAVSIGTPVTVVDQPVKVGRSAGELYLEVHPSQEDVDSIEETGQPAAIVAPDAETAVLKAAGADADRVDWYAVGRIAQRRTGVPEQITKPRAF
jgi:L,D-transpeptidase ErfK/SrfK